MAPTRRRRPSSRSGRRTAADRAAAAGAVGGLVLITLSLIAALTIAVKLHISTEEVAATPTGSGEPTAAGTGVTKGGAGTATGETNPRVTGVSITEFGAACDGSTDDTDALESGIEAMQESGETLFIPAGTCLIDGL